MSYPTPERPVDPGTPPVEGLPLRDGPDADEIQGNILAGFNKDHQSFLFLRFADQSSGRAWLSALGPRIATTKQVSTFNEQFSRARRARGGDDPEDLKAVWTNVSLTREGLRVLSSDLVLQPGVFDAFEQGPVARAGQLGDQGPERDPSHWVVGRADQEIHAILTVAADARADLRGEVDSMRQRAAENGVTIVFEQRGDTLPGARAGHEHFGFKDGISQPGVRGFHAVQANAEGEDERESHPGTEMIAPGEFVLGHPREQEGEGRPEHTGTAPLPHPEWMANGSFHVFRRLRQDVPGWWAQVNAQQGEVAAADPSDGMTPDQLAAKLVGRWRSGTPLAHAADRDNRSAQCPEQDNNFDYEGDDAGHTTPRFAHIRKMYPRDARFGDDRRRILRRGIPFGRPFDPARGRGHGVDGQRGLLFNVYMASIEDQFEFLQAAWANNSSFPSVVFEDNRTDGPDPVIGDAPDPVELRRGGTPNETVNHLDFRRFVHTTGAVYAFAPSIATIQRLGAGEL